MKKLTIVMLVLVTIVVAGVWGKNVQVHAGDEVSVLVGYKDDWDTVGWPETISIVVEMTSKYYNKNTLGTAEPYELVETKTDKTLLTLSKGDKEWVYFDIDYIGATGKIVFTVKVENGEGGEMRVVGSATKDLRF